ncbi:hypothetical protein KKC67_02885 [Patescibacteria group bacterium]|nr:hypothetical protein [Patescibacteria group bacterium]MBU0879756.1 hypothetical protein [Patescibacteria group bacterium]MBU0880181.1 hypothetical protein [Patescibacteria group bacterium]MBU0897764.1 hypothetical protein [Patescibacteria group bacterium]MBU1062837.1 hypothetical protein [Patescibacteria group bacterium]
MTLTPEQFNKLVLKEDVKNFEEKLEKIEGKLDILINLIDSIVKKHKDFEIEMTANQGAHNRFEENFTKTHKRVKILEEKTRV